MRTYVEKDNCLGCGACSATVPDVFGIDESGHAYVVLDKNSCTAEIPSDVEDEVREAAEYCPTEAIKIKE